MQFNLVQNIFFITLICIAGTLNANEKSLHEIKTNRDNKIIYILQQNYNFRFKTADSLYHQLEKESGVSSDLLLAKSAILWWKIISEKNSPLYKEFNRNLEMAENFLFKKEKNKNDYEFIYKAASLYGFAARMEGLEKNYVKAIVKVNNCLKYLVKSLGKEKEFEYFLLSSGLYNYYMVTCEEEYPFTLPYLKLYPKGDLNKGINFLKEASQHNDVVMSTEANYFLMKIYLEKKDYSESEKYCEKLITKYPSNLIFLYYQFLLQLKQKKTYDARVFMARIRIAAGKNPQLNDIQKTYFYDMAKDELDKYLAKNGKK